MSIFLLKKRILFVKNKLSLQRPQGARLQGAGNPKIQTQKKDTPNQRNALTKSYSHIKGISQNTIQPNIILCCSWHEHKPIIQICISIHHFCLVYISNPNIRNNIFMNW